VLTQNLTRFAHSDSQAFLGSDLIRAGIDSQLSSMPTFKEKCQAVVKMAVQFLVVIHPGLRRRLIPRMGCHEQGGFCTYGG